MLKKKPLGKGGESSEDENNVGLDAKESNRTFKKAMNNLADNSDADPIQETLTEDEMSILS